MAGAVTGAGSRRGERAPLPALTAADLACAPIIRRALVLCEYRDASNDAMIGGPWRLSGA